MIVLKHFRKVFGLQSNPINLLFHKLCKEFTVPAFAIRVRHANVEEAYDFGIEQNRFGAIPHCARLETLF